MLQLTPPIPLWHPASNQAVDAVLVLDYSAEHDLMFGVIRRDGQLWVYRASELRGQANATLGRNLAGLGAGGAGFGGQSTVEGGGGGGGIPRPVDTWTRCFDGGGNGGT